jgi:hypothetical protein
VPKPPAWDDQRERRSTVLLLDECECGAGADRGPADNSLSSQASTSSAPLGTPAFVREQARSAVGGSLSRTGVPIGRQPPAAPRASSPGRPASPEDPLEHPRRSEQLLLRLRPAADRYRSSMATQQHCWTATHTGAYINPRQRREHPKTSRTRAPRTAEGRNVPHPGPTDRVLADPRVDPVRSPK